MIISVLSLFSGIGLFDLGVLAALEEAGIDAHLTAQVEIDPFCRRVLERHYPNVSREVTDVRDVYPGNVPWSDLFIGGFPCQDVSAAGTQDGLSGERSGLWWEFRRAIGEMRPRAALIENVFSGLSHWHGPVRCSLETMGYRTWARRISAADVGAPHRRDRVFVLAHRRGDRLEREQRTGAASADAAQGGQLAESARQRRDEGERRERQEGWWTVASVRCEMGDASGSRRSPGGPRVHDQGEGFACESGVADADRIGREVVEKLYGEPYIGTADRDPCGRHADGSGGAAWRQAQPGVGRGAHGRSAWLDAHRWPAGRGQPQHDWEPSRTAYGVANQTVRLKALGNAVTPHQGREAMRWALDVLGWK